MERKEYINGTAIVVLETPTQRTIIKQLTDDEIEMQDQHEIFEKFCEANSLNPANCLYMIGDNIHVEKI